MNPIEPGRMSPKNDRTNPIHGVVAWSPVKSLGFTAHALVVIVGGYLTFGAELKATRPAREQKRPRATVFFNEP
jgi:hypothetical protein